MKREEQKIENTWKMEDMYSSDQAMENDLDKALKMISEYNKYKDNVSKNKETLLDYLKFIYRNHGLFLVFCLKVH